MKASRICAFRVQVEGLFSAIGGESLDTLPGPEAFPNKFFAALACHCDVSKFVLSAVALKLGHGHGHGHGHSQGHG